MKAITLGAILSLIASVVIAQPGQGRGNPNTVTRTGNVTGCEEPCLEWDLTQFEGMIERYASQPDDLWEAWLDSMAAWGFFTRQGNNYTAVLPHYEEYDKSVGELITTDSLGLETRIRGNRAFVFKKVNDSTFVSLNPKYYQATRFRVNRVTKNIQVTTVPTRALRNNPTDQDMRDTYGPAFPTKSQRDVAMENKKAKEKQRGKRHRGR